MTNLERQQLYRLLQLRAAKKSPFKPTAGERRRLRKIVKRICDSRK